MKEQTIDQILIADMLQNDPLIKQGKELILAAINTHKNKIMQPRPPISSLAVKYEDAVKEMGRLRGQELFYPYIASGFGNGALVELADGSIKYDFISGIGTHWGHMHPDLINAALDAALLDVCMQTNLQHNRDTLELMNLLTQQSGLKHCFLTSSGAMANENALKIILQKKHPSCRILAFEKCFMGRTLALSQITDKPDFRQGLPDFVHVDYVPFYDEKNPQSTTHALSILDMHLKRYPGSHACMCFELILGEGGNYAGSELFFTTLMKKLKENKIAIYVDEVQTFGRTDHLFAFQHFNLDSYVDVVTCGKLTHACATLFSEEFCPKPGLIAQTFLASTSAIKTALAVINNLINGQYLGKEGKNVHLRKHFVNHLQRIEEKYPNKIKGPFGYGLMIACTPFNGEKKQVIQFAKALFDAGIIVFTAGNNPTRIRFLIPPGGITEKQIDEGMQIFEKTLVSL